MFVCRQCGWAGLDGEFSRAERAGGGWHEVCPSCGTVKLALEGDIGCVHPLLHELRYLERDVKDEEQRTRNEKWATRLRSNLRHLTLYAAQAQLEEEITPGVRERVAALQERIQGLLAEQVILPPAMRKKPSPKVMEALIEPHVSRAVKRIMLPLKVTGEVTAGLPSDGDPGSLVRAVLVESFSPTQLIPAIRVLMVKGATDAEQGIRRLAFVVTRQAEALEQIPKQDWLQAVLLEEKIERFRRKTDRWYMAAREWARQDPFNRHQWDQYGRLAEKVNRLRENITDLVRQVAQADIEPQVAKEVARLSDMTRTEAARMNKRPLEVAAGWVRSRSKKYFSSPEIRELVAYPLAQRLTENGF